MGDLIKVDFKKKQFKKPSSFEEIKMKVVSLLNKIFKRRKAPKQKFELIINELRKSS